MKTGANRTTIGSYFFILDEPRPKPLGKIRNTDFAAFPEAEREILDEFIRHKSFLRAQQNAPDLRQLQEKVDGLAGTVQICRDQMAAFLATGEDSQTRNEFRAAMTDLLLEHDLSRQKMDVSMEETIDALAKVGMYLSAAHLALAGRVNEGELVEPSSRSARDEHFRRFHAILLRYVLDAKVGETSLIVHLVIRLERKFEPATKSGPQASKEAEADRRRRKDLAAEIKAAVYPQKGG